MRKIQTANQLNGRAIGSMFFSGFGTGWLFMALAAKEWIGIVTVSSVMLGMSILFLTAFYLLRQSRRMPRVPGDPAIRRAFVWINVIQWIAIALVILGFTKLHIDAYVTSAIAVIIGLHLFPLARLFHYPMHYATGAVLVAWAVASAIFVPVEQMQGTAALGNGVILWFSAAVTLAVGVNAARQPVPAYSVL